MAVSPAPPGLRTTKQPGTDRRRSGSVPCTIGSGGRKARGESGPRGGRFEGSQVPGAEGSSRVRSQGRKAPRWSQVPGAEGSEWSQVPGAEGSEWSQVPGKPGTGRRRSGSVPCTSGPAFPKRGQALVGGEVAKAPALPGLRVLVKAKHREAEKWQGPCTSGLAKPFK